MSYTLECWAAPVAQLAEELTRDGAHGPEQAVELAAAVLEKTGEFIDSVSHSSSGGDWFRDEFVEGTLADLIGADAAGFLLERDLAGTTWEGYPSMGWLTGAELAGVIAKLDEAGDAALTDLDDPEAEELLAPLVDILRATAATGQDLVTVYS